MGEQQLYEASVVERSQPDGFSAFSFSKMKLLCENRPINTDCNPKTGSHFCDDIFSKLNLIEMEATECV